MAITKPVWTENQPLRAAATLAAGATSGHNIDLDASGFDCVVIQIDIAHGTASSVEVEFFSSSDSGVAFDTITLPGSFATAGADLKRSVLITAHPFVRMVITNNDGTNATGNISAVYAGRNWETL